MAKNEQIRIDLTAEDDASKVIDKVADAAADLEKQSPEIDITATDQASATIDAVAAEASALSKQDAEVVLRAKVDAAKADLKALRADLEQTADKAGDTQRALDRVGGDGGDGLKTRGNAIADLTGPLGSASSAASDFAGVFDGLGDIAEDAASKFGLSQKAAGLVSSAIGGLGVAVAVGAAAWTYFADQTRKAREQAEKLVTVQKELRELIADRKWTDAAAKLTENYSKAYDAARKLGVSATDITKYLTGQADELPGVKARWDDLSDAQKENYAQIQVARGQYIIANGTLSEQDAILQAVATTLSGVTKATDDATLAAMRGTRATGDMAASTEDLTDASLDAESAQGRVARAIDTTSQKLDNIRGKLDMEQAMLNFNTKFMEAMEKAGTDAGLTAQDILDLKLAILDVADYANLNPVQVESLLKAIDEGQIAGVRALAEQAYLRNPVLIKTVLRPPTFLGNRPEETVGITQTAAGGGGETVNVYQTIPRGYHGDVLADARKAARRSGRLYQRTRR